MRRYLLYSAIGFLALLWLRHVQPEPEGTLPERSSRPTARSDQRDSPRPRGRAGPDPAPAELLLQSGGGLCGTEVPPPVGAPTPALPEELRALTQSQPTPAQITAATEALGVELPKAADPGVLSRTASQRRDEIASVVDEPLDLEDPPWAWSLRAKNLRELGRRKEAVDAARRAYALKPDADSAQTLALSLEETGQPREAMQLLEGQRSHTTEQTNLAWLDAQLGYICATRSDDRCADRAVKALEQNPSQGSLASFTKAVHLTMRGSLDEARSTYEESLQRDRDPVALSNLAEVEACLGRTGESRKLYLESFERHLTPEIDTSILTGLAYAHLRDGDLAPAWLYGAAALAGTGGGAYASLPRGALALTALVGGDLSEARNQSKLAYAADPEDDLVRRRCFGDPAEAAAMRALHVEAKGNRTAAQEAWLAVARGRNQALSLMARRALSELCR